MAKYFSHEELVEDLRKEVGESSQTEVAAKYGVSRSTINEILSGRQGISERFAEILGYERELMFRKAS
jgi:plasmid maintenance system antidote protein VapI